MRSNSPESCSNRLCVCGGNPQVIEMTDDYENQGYDLTTYDMYGDQFQEDMEFLPQTLDEAIDAAIKMCKRSRLDRHCCSRVVIKEVQGEDSYWVAEVVAPSDDGWALVRTYKDDLYAAMFGINPPSDWSEEALNDPDGFVERGMEQLLYKPS